MAAHETTETELGETPPRPVWRKRSVRFLFALALLIGLAVLGAWLARDRLAGGVIDEQLAALDLPATYDVERIGPGEQVLTDIVIGDPARPDLTIARMRVALGWNWRTMLSGPTVGRVTVDKARLFGTVNEDGISFGSLDPLLFGGDDTEAGLPAIDLALRDGSALIETPYGPVGVKLDGEGDLASGFTATAAATAPALAIADCRLSKVTAFGTLQTRSDGLDFEGPVRLGNARCSESEVAVRTAAFQTTASTDLKFSDVSIATQTDIASLAAAGSTLRAIRGPVEAKWRAGDIDAVLDLATGGATLAGSRLSSGALDARIRLREGYSRWEADGEMQAERCGYRDASRTRHRDRARVCREHDAGTAARPVWPGLGAATKRYRHRRALHGASQSAGHQRYRPAGNRPQCRRRCRAVRVAASLCPRRAGPAATVRKCPLGG